MPAAALEAELGEADASVPVLLSMKEFLRMVFTHTKMPSAAGAPLRLDPPLVVAVVSLHRYQVDDTFQDRTGLETEELGNVYDVILTDGQERLKCVVCPSQNNKVEKGLVRPCSIIKVLDATFHYNVHDASMDPRAVFVLKDLELVTSSLQHWEHACGVCRKKVEAFSRHPSGKDAQMQPILQQYTAESRVYRPLGAKRKYYLSEYDKSALPGPSMPFAVEKYDHPSLETTYDEFKYLWNRNDDLILHTKKDLQELNPNSLSRSKPIILKVADIATGYSQEKGKQRLQLLVGRVMRKSTVRQFRRINKDGYPLSAMLTVADSTGTVDVLLWNSTCARFLQTVHIGDVVVMGHYRCKRNVYSGSKEIHLNSQNPGGILRVVEENPTFSELLQSVQLENIRCIAEPKLMPELLTTDSSATLAQDEETHHPEYVSCMGNIVDVSPIYLERTASRLESEASHNHFQEYRWMTMADHTVLDRNGHDPLGCSSLPRLASQSLFCSSLRLDTFNFLKWLTPPHFSPRSRHAWENYGYQIISSG
jgi:hypothetical protein